MLQNSNKNQYKMILTMSISAIVLTVLLVFSLFKSDEVEFSSNSLLFVSIISILLFIIFRQYLVSKDKKNINTQSSKNINEEQISDSILPTKSNVRFSDVAGIEDVKQELTQVVDFLNNPKKYLKHDIVLPKGVLLVGPPGVGKTMIAKAVANEANVPFYYQSGASFVHIYVGMGAKKVRELFNVAKANSPSIVFIDEIDAVGKTRGVAGNDEREATLNELLTQMDGFDDKSTVMVIAATNKVELLDEALLRAGRFDRRVFLQKPNKEDRLKILRKALENKLFKFDIEKLAQDTTGFNSAALVTLINEALLNMVVREGTTLLEDDIEIAKNKIQFGKKQVQVLSDDEKEILAIYQAAKSFISNKKVQLFDEGIILDQLNFPTLDQLKYQLSILLAGSVATKLFFNKEILVYKSELDQAYELAEQIVNTFKLNNLTSTELIKDVKKSLHIKLEDNEKIILEKKEILLKDEVVF